MVFLLLLLIILIFNVGNIKKYIDAAEEHGYDVKFETLDPTNYSEDFIRELAERQKTTHNVPEHVIIDMLKKWED